MCIPNQTGHWFRRKPATHSEAKRPPPRGRCEKGRRGATQRL